MAPGQVASTSPQRRPVGKEDGMLGIRTQASWILITAFTVSALSELFRSTAKAGTSKYDSTRGL
jgi:hypothetical protein